MAQPFQFQQGAIIRDLVAAVAAASNPADVAAAAARVSDPQIKDLLLNPRHHQLLFRIFHNGHGAHTLEGIFTNFLRVLKDYTEMKKVLGRPVWEDIMVDFPFHITSECVTFFYNDKLYLLTPCTEVYKVTRAGPIRNPDLVLGLLEVDVEENTLRQVELFGDSPAADKLFCKLPHYFIVNQFLYLLHPENGHMCINRLDMNSFMFSRFPITGEPPTIPKDGLAGTEAVYYKDYIYLVISTTSVKRISLVSLSPAWEALVPSGLGPQELTGGSLLWNHCIWVLSNTEPAVFSLSLESLEWTKHVTIGGPTLALRDCYLPEIHGNEAVLIRKSDYSELWKLDMQTKKWRKDESYGTRPGNYATNPSYVIHKNIMYCIGGQFSGRLASKNHLKRLNLTSNAHVRVSRIVSKLAKMYDDPYCDLIFRFENEPQVVRAHRSILCQYEYFNAMLSGRFSEGLKPEEMEVAGVKMQCYPIVIRTVSYMTFKALIEFIYERLNFMSTDIDLVDLYQAADMFLLPDLMDDIVTFFESKMEALDNIRLYETMLDTATPPSQKRKAEKAIAKEYTKIAKTEQFLDFQKRQQGRIPDFEELGKKMTPMTFRAAPAPAAAPSTSSSSTAVSTSSSSTTAAPRTPGEE